MTSALRTDPAVVGFEEAARRFVTLAQTPPSDGQRYAEELYRSVLSLSRGTRCLAGCAA